MPRPNKHHETFECYLVTCLKNGKKYVGIASEGANRRWIKHTYDAHKGAKTPLHQAMRKHGVENFKVETLQVCTSWEEVCDLEKQMIQKHKTLTKYRSGYNISTGGEGPFGVERSTETRKKLSSITKKWFSEDPSRIDYLRRLAKKQMEDPVHRELVTKKAKERFADSAYSERYKKILKEFWSRPDSDLLRRKLQKEVMSRPSAKENLREKAKGQMKSPENREKSKTGALVQWKNPEYKIKMQTQMKRVGAKNWRNPNYRERMRKMASKPVIANGKRYESLNDASEALGIAANTICARLKNRNFPDYYYLPRKRYIIIDGIRFESVNSAAKSLAISNAVCLRRINNPDYHNYKMIEES